jgi:hypothetical protein
MLAVRVRPFGTAGSATRRRHTMLTRQPGSNGIRPQVAPKFSAHQSIGCATVSEIMNLVEMTQPDATKTDQSSKRDRVAYLKFTRTS